MPQPPLPIRSYVDTDVREVFENFSVEEIQGIQRRISHEIERKREELRMLVGERYRDLIDAADTICTMKTSSVHVFQGLSNLRMTITGLPKQLTLSSNRSLKDDDRRKLTEEELEVAAGLKLALEIPSEVQYHLEKDEVIPALHLILFFTQRILPNEKKYKWMFLQAEGRDLQKSAKALVDCVLDFCDSGINSITISIQKLSECLLVKQIVTKSTVDEILSAWLKAKVCQCRPALQKKDSEFVSIVATTLRAIYQIFIDPELYSVTAKAIRKLKINASNFGFRLSPKVVTDYNEKSIPIEDPTRVTRLAQILRGDFVIPLKELLENQKNYLEEFPSLGHLQGHRQNSMLILKQDSEDLMRLVLGPTTTLWAYVFSPVFQRRAEVLAKGSIDEIITFLKTTGFPKFQGVDATFDLVSFVWKPSPINNGSPPNDNLKIKCLTPGISQLCEDLEFRFSELLVDFQALGDSWLKDFISAHLLREFDTFVLEIVDFENIKYGNGKSFGRFATGIMDLCPTLWKLLEKNDGMKLKQSLLSQSEKCWSQWTEYLLKTFKSELENCMGMLTAENITSFMPMAEIYEAEGGDSGEKFVPSLRIPVEITHTLHSLLFSICMELSKVGPQVISKTVKDDFRIALAKSIVGFYDKLSHVQEERFLTPQMALQFIFDLKFAQWFHSSLAGTTDAIVHKFKIVIDPFDWDIVNPRLTLNLKRFLFENQLTIGLLFSEENHGFIAQNFKTKSSLSFPIPTRQLLYNQLPLLPV